MILLILILSFNYISCCYGLKTSHNLCIEKNVNCNENVVNSIQEMELYNDVNFFYIYIFLINYILIIIIDSNNLCLSFIFRI